MLIPALRRILGIFTRKRIAIPGLGAVFAYFNAEAMIQCVQKIVRDGAFYAGRKSVAEALIAVPAWTYNTSKYYVYQWRDRIFGNGTEEQANKSPSRDDKHESSGDSKTDKDRALAKNPSPGFMQLAGLHEVEREKLDKSRTDARRLFGKSLRMGAELFEYLQQHFGTTPYLAIASTSGIRDDCANLTYAGANTGAAYNKTIVSARRYDALLSERNRHQELLSSVCANMTAYLPPMHVHSPFEYAAYASLQQNPWIATAPCDWTCKMRKIATGLSSKSKSTLEVRVNFIAITAKADIAKMCELTSSFDDFVKIGFGLAVMNAVDLERKCYELDGKGCNPTNRIAVREAAIDQFYLAYPRESSDNQRYVTYQKKSWDLDDSIAKGIHCCLAHHDTCQDAIDDIQRSSLAKFANSTRGEILLSGYPSMPVPMETLITVDDIRTIGQDCLRK